MPYARRQCRCIFSGVCMQRPYIISVPRPKGKDLWLCELQDTFTQSVVILKYNNIRLS
ncbi:MAG: hypothetical protein LBM07_07940 [Culturomica sp.]|nr:hypothetical protein [Culturomica sp.]